MAAAETVTEIFAPSLSNYEHALKFVVFIGGIIQLLVVLSLICVSDPSTKVLPFEKEEKSAIKLERINKSSIRRRKR